MIPTVTTEVDAYDPVTRTWTTLAPLPSGRQGIGAVVVDGALLVPGGAPSAGGSEQTSVLLQLS